MSLMIDGDRTRSAKTIFPKFSWEQSEKQDLFWPLPFDSF